MPVSKSPFSELMSVLEDPSRESVDTAIEAIHADYGELEGIFDAAPASHER